MKIGENNISFAFNVTPHFKIHVLKLPKGRVFHIGFFVFAFWKWRRNKSTSIVRIIKNFEGEKYDFL